MTYNLAVTMLRPTSDTGAGTLRAMGLGGVNAEDVMRVLGLETAGEMGGVGTVDGPRVLSEVTFEARADHGAKLALAVDAALGLARLPRTDLDLIVVSRGPGSFTGLRIGLAFAKGLARALEIPIVGVPTMDAYAERARFWTGPIWALFPDRRESVYRTAYQSGSAVGSPDVCDIKDIIEELSERGASERLLVGPGAEAHRDALQSALLDVRLGSSGLARPSGAAVAQLGHARYDERGRRDELYELEPLYAQGPPAQPVNQGPPLSV